MKRNWLILALLLLSFSLHLIKLGQNPTFISDEASISYNAYCLLKTGRDEWGNLLPLTFKAFGEYKLPLYIYFSLIPVFLFGLTELATRFSSAFFGALSGFFIYLIARKLLPLKKKNFSFPLTVFFLFVINPWHLQTSRMALEANLALFFFLIGFCFFLKERFAWTAFFFGLTFYTYNTFRVFVPLFILLSFLFKKKEIKKLLFPALIFLLVISPLIFSGFKGSGERIFKVSIFADPGIILRIEEKRVDCQRQLDSRLCRLVYNRPVVYTSEIFKNYLTHFDPRFLFLKGAGLAQYAMPGFGAAYLFEIFFLPLGFWQFFKNRSLKKKLLPWLIAAPVATSFTGPAHPVRSLVLMPLLPLFSGLGLSWFLKWKKCFSKTFLLALFLVSFLSFGSFLYRYFRVYPTQTGSTWQGGYRPLYQFLKKVESDFDQIRLTKFYGEPHIFYLFYRQFDPEKYQRGSQVVRYDREDRWVNVDGIGNYIFFEKPNWQIPGLVVLAAFESQPEMKPIKEIFYQNGEVAFKIYKIE